MKDVSFPLASRCNFVKEEEKTQENYFFAQSPNFVLPLSHKQIHYANEVLTPLGFHLHFYTL